MSGHGSADAFRRPSPKELLKLADRQTRGRLKVFLGMAPGVGKTYAMLSAARAAKAEGIDVVVGVVETHGRSETASLLEGLEVLPRKPIDYRGQQLMEFDLDGAIARAPKLLVVDEFAHTNAPGQIYAKRYQDVEEILRAGIDVWTTLNIQHLESLTDVIEGITGVKVREIVPDKVVLKADEIVVVDLAPDDLIQRLKEGKVYLPEDARRAVDQFFRPSNLTALRELALRHTADRVDEQMLAQLRRQGIEGPWPTAERILVCVASNDLAETIVRAAARIATAQKAEWIALHIRTSERESADRALRRKADKALRLAERLGATTTRLNTADVPDEILRYAKRNNITQIVIGRAFRAGLTARLRKSLPDELIARSDGIVITVVSGKAEQARSNWLTLPTPHVALTNASASIVAVAVAVLAAFGLERLTPLPNLSMVFLLAVLVSALRFGVFSGVFAAFLSFLAYNFFFIEPRYTFTVAEPQELLALMIFLVAAIATGGLAGRLQEQSQALVERADTTQAQYDFSHRLSGAARLDDVLWVLANQAAVTAHGGSVVLLDHGELTIRSSWPPIDTLSTTDWAAARWAFERNEPAGRLTGTLPLASFQFRPIVSSKGPVGVAGVAPEEGDEAISSAADAALQFMVDQAAIAIERTMLVDAAAKVEQEREGEQLRTALLASLSHDFRTPLAAILGSVSSLRELGDKMSAADRKDLLVTIEEEAARLSRFLTNVLEMTRLEAGAIDARRDLIDVADVVRAAVDSAAKYAPARRIAVEIAPRLPPIQADAALLEQVLLNLLDNANKYGDPNGVTRVTAVAASGVLTLAVSDQGIGIPHEALKKVFDKFYRVGGNDGRAVGTGLGLSICAGLVHAMGGDIVAESPIEAGKGTRVVVSFPLPNSAPAQAGPEMPE